MMFILFFACEWRWGIVSTKQSFQFYIKETCQAYVGGANRNVHILMLKINSSVREFWPFGGYGNLSSAPPVGVQNSDGSRFPSNDDPAPDQFQRTGTSPHSHPGPTFPSKQTDELEVECTFSSQSSRKLLRVKTVKLPAGQYRRPATEKASALENLAQTLKDNDVPTIKDWKTDFGFTNVQKDKVSTPMQKHLQDSMRLKQQSQSYRSLRFKIKLEKDPGNSDAKRIDSMRDWKTELKKSLPWNHRKSQTVFFSST